MARSLRLTQALTLTAVELIASPAAAQYAAGPIPYINTPMSSVQDTVNQSVSNINTYLKNQGTGANPPGGVSGQVQYNNGGSFGGVTTTYYVAATCDGTIIYGGGTANSGSNVISTPAYSFTTADIGKHVSLMSSLLNSYSSSAPAAFVGTITGVSGGNATLSGNAGITTTNLLIRMYNTDNKAAIQASINAAHAQGGGHILFPAGVCATSGPITFYDNIRFEGANNGATVLMLANGSNSDMFVSYNFASLTGTNNTGGVKDCSFEHLQFDGNRAANTGSGPGTAGGVGDAIRMYSFECTAYNLLINYFASDGMYTEWSDTAGSPIQTGGVPGPDGMEHVFSTIKFGYNAGYGQTWNGAHDSHEDHLTFLGNGVGGLLMLGLGSPLSIYDAHGYAEAGYDIDAAGPNLVCIDCQMETGMRLQEFNYNLVSDNISTLTLGKSGGGAVYQLHIANSAVTTLDNTLTLGSGFQDTWASSVIGSISGSYIPDCSSGTIGLSDVICGGQSLRWITGASYAMSMGINNSSVFTMNLNGDLWAANAGGQIQMGFGFTPSFKTGVGLDLAPYTGTLSSFTWPTDSTGNEPTGNLSATRFNSTLNNWEGYNGSHWVSLISGANGVTGSTAASWGSNCPAVTCSAPYTWIKVTGPDGSTLYVPGYK